MSTIKVKPIRINDKIEDMKVTLICEFLNQKVTLKNIKAKVRYEVTNGLVFSAVIKGVKFNHITAKYIVTDNIDTDYYDPHTLIMKWDNPSLYDGLPNMFRKEFLALGLDKKFVITPQDFKYFNEYLYTNINPYEIVGRKGKRTFIIRKMKVGRNIFGRKIITSNNSTYPTIEIYMNKNGVGHILNSDKSISYCPATKPKHFHDVCF